MSRIRANTITNQNANGAPNFPDGITVTGIVTATTTSQNITGTLAVTGDATFSGNVGIAGTLTYEDVKNIDSVGVITARSGIQIGVGGTIGSSGGGIVTYFGDGSQLTGLASDKIEEGNSKVEVVDTGTGSISFVLDGSEKLNIGAYTQFNQLVFVDNTIQTSGNMDLANDIRHMNNTGTRIGFPSNDVIHFRTNNAERLRIDSSGRVGVNQSTFATADTMLSVSETTGHCEIGIISKNDSGVVINMGDPDSYNQGRIKYDNSDNSLTFRTSATDRLRISSDGYVTKPSQPRAFVKIYSTTTLSNTKIDNWASPTYNVGNLWNAANSRFIAPVDGLYLLGGNFRIGAPGHIRVVRFNIHAYNTSNQVMAIYGGGVGGTHNYDDGSGGYDHPYVSFTNVIYLQANQYLELHCAETAVQHTSYIQVNNEQSAMWCVLLQ